MRKPETTVWYRVGFFCGVFTLQSTATALGAISRDSLFLQSYDASSISTLILGLSVATAFIFTRLNQGLAHLEQIETPLHIIYAHCAIATGSILLFLSLFSIWFPFFASLYAILFYAWVEITIHVLTQQFWSFCPHVFDVSESKQHFGRITFGSTLGNMLGSVVIIPFIESLSLSTEYTLVMSSILQIIVAIIIYYYQEILMSMDVPLEHFKSNNQSPTQQTKLHERKVIKSPEYSNEQSIGIENSTFDIFRSILQREYMWHICIFECLATVLRTMVDRTTLSTLSDSSSPDEVKKSLVQINFYQCLLLIPLQLMSGAFFRRFGVMLGITLLPCVTLLYGLSSYQSEALLLVICSRALYNAVSTAIFNPAKELLWLPIDGSERSTYKSFVNGAFRSACRVGGSAFSILISRDAFIRTLGPSSISISIAVLAVFWILDAHSARKSYAAEFYASLKSGYLDLSSPIVDFTPDQIVMLRDTFRTGRLNQIHFVVSMLRPSHVEYFAQDLRQLFYATARPLPLSTKIKLLELHKQSLDESSNPQHEMRVFTIMDIITLIQENHDEDLPTSLRLNAILAAGHEPSWRSSEVVVKILSQLVSKKEDERSVQVCAAIALLKLSNWAHEDANVLLHQLVHEESNLRDRVMCLKTVGKELPEMISDGYIVYLLHHKSPQIVKAAVNCCSIGTRASRMLISPLIKHLSNMKLQNQIVEALKGFDKSSTWYALCEYIDSMIESVVQSKDINRNQTCAYSDGVVVRREKLTGILKILGIEHFGLEDRLFQIFRIIDALVATSIPHDSIEKYDARILNNLLSGDTNLEEMCVDALLAIITESDEYSALSVSEITNSIVVALDTKVEQAYEIEHMINLFYQICPKSVAVNDDDTSPLLLQHADHKFQLTKRVLLKLLSVGFPENINIGVLLQGLRSDIKQTQTIIQEILETLLPSSYKQTVLPLLFPQSPAQNQSKKMRQKVANLFENKSGVDLLMDGMQSSTVDPEVRCMALHHFLHISKYHSNFIPDSYRNKFRNQLLHELLKDDLTKELLIETYHSSPDALLFEEFPEIEKAKPPVISRVAISHCLRESLLLENENAIGILHHLLDRFIPMKLEAGETLVAEGESAPVMFVVAHGKIQVHREGRILLDLGFGACLGQTAVLRFTDRVGCHVASATALTEATLLSISRENLDLLISENSCVARGVLNAVASSLRWMYYEPLQVIAQSGSLPRRSQSVRVLDQAQGNRGYQEIINSSGSQTLSLKRSLSLSKAISRLFHHAAEAPRSPINLKSPKSHGGREYAISRQRQSVQSANWDRKFSRRYRASISVSGINIFNRDCSVFEKCIHLKGSRWMRQLDDEKVTLVAQLATVVNLKTDEILYSEGDPAANFYLVVEGLVHITSQVSTVNRTEGLFFYAGDSFGEESFMTNTNTNGQAIAKERTRLFAFNTNQLIELSVQHEDIVHVVVAWLAEKLEGRIDDVVGQDNIASENEQANM